MSVINLVNSLRQQLEASVVGQQHLVNRMLIALLVDGHILVEGAPGLAKTRAVKTLASSLEGTFQRVQFTPDLLPADLTGTEVYRPADGTFVFQKGPLFNNLVLADEINRAPAKVQSALLEAMGEHQISVGHESYALPRLFMVMATQNPIEQEGTYPLPEAQLDRFVMQVLVGYPDASHEAHILRLVRNEAMQDAKLVNAAVTGEPLSRESLFEARAEVMQIHVADNIEDYIIRLITETRQPVDTDLARWIEYGASPRGTIALDSCARAHAWLAGRDYVSPEDIQSVIADVLRHRVLLSYEAEADGVSADNVIAKLLQLVAVP